jgi:tricarballylate dehydrogenase
MSDVLRVNSNETDEPLARTVVRQSEGCPKCMTQFGVRFQPSLRGTLHLSRTNAFFLGGGKALMNTYYAAAECLGIDVRYDADVTGIDLDDGEFGPRASPIAEPSGVVRARAAVLASGGFEANLEWLQQVWGDSAKNFLVRGTPYNRGTILRIMLDAGAQPVGDPRECHAAAIDGRSPKYDGGIVTRLDYVPLGIAVNRNGERFCDEGEDIWPKRYMHLSPAALEAAIRLLERGEPGSRGANGEAAGISD